MDISGGVNVVGYHRQALGLGSEARRLTRYLREHGIGVSTIDAPHSDSQVLNEIPESDNRWQFPNTVSVVTAQVLPRVMETLGASNFQSTRHAGMWYWELEHIPPSITGAFELVDEIWAGSEFIGAAFRRHSTKPVFVLPKEIPTPPPQMKSRYELSIPDQKFVVLCTFDFFSVFERKNPLACIEGFRRAFEEDDEVLLMIKSQNADKFPVHADQLSTAIADAENIVWRDEFVSDVEQWSLIANADVLVSTHRSEGLGLHILQAIACGKQVVCTGYSAPAEYVREPFGHHIDFTMVPIPTGIEAYPEGALWADPDIEHLAALLREARFATEQMARPALQVTNSNIKPK